MSKNFVWGNVKGGGSGDVTAAGNNTFTGDNTFNNMVITKNGVRIANGDDPTKYIDLFFNYESGNNVNITPSVSSGLTYSNESGFGLALWGNVQNAINNLIKTITLTLDSTPDTGSSTTNNWYNKESNGTQNSHVFGFTSPSIPDNLRDKIMTCKLIKSGTYQVGKSYDYSMSIYDNEVKVIIDQIKPLNADDIAYYNGMTVVFYYLNI